MNFTKKDTSAMKGIAIILMFFHHCFLNKERWASVPFAMFNKVEKMTYYNISFAPFSENIITYLASFSKICVPIFVFLTGYGMAASYRMQKDKISD